MSLHTVNEYCQTLRQHTKIAGITVDIVSAESEKSRADIISVLLGEVELWQLNDTGRLDQLASSLPTRLRSSQSDLDARVRLLGLAQKPNGVEQLRRVNHDLSEGIDKGLAETSRPDNIVTASRALRKLVEELIWSANEFSIALWTKEIRTGHADQD